MRHLIVVLGDQLNRDSAAFDKFDPAKDAVWMAEVTEESTHVWSHKARIALFLSAMRHFRDALREEGIRVHYRELSEGSLADFLKRDIAKLKPQRVIAAEPGDYRVRDSLAPMIEFVEDRHFLCSTAEFREHARGRKQLRMEFFYREMRRRHEVLMDGGQPVGGQWNFDHENRGAFGKAGPLGLPAPRRFQADAITKKVIGLVGKKFAKHPGSLEDFDWPVTPGEALDALDDFIAHRLPLFGQYQDAMWTAEPWLYHSRISAAMNLKLLNPRDAIRAAEKADAPLAAREGFIRQILGWREYVRGVYWLRMPEYVEGNALDAHARLPKFYWTAETDMACLREAIGQTLRYGYAHHIQRLMVTGLYALVAGVDPRQVHEWYLAVYVDAVEWVELPNTIGMSQFADGGYLASKPYAATGKYIARMSNYCAGCRYDPAESTGERACPITTHYWDFLIRNEAKLKKIPRMEMQLRNLVRIAPAKKKAIRERAQELRDAH
ncbi:MAG: cryptochrome/photolyase family protein [Bryobacteraceae bacterium]|nr:cryptochrome/photolyase family protein [Bryobacteraceae bacterium]